MTAPSTVLVLYISATILSGDDASPYRTGESQKWTEDLQQFSKVSCYSSSQEKRSKKVVVREGSRGSLLPVEDLGRGRYGLGTHSPRT